MLVASFVSAFFAGYLTSDLDRALDGYSVDYEGAAFGATATYDDGVRYADLVVAGNLLDADYFLGGPEVDADTLNIAVAAR